ncbi:MAG: sigma-70 family RNA polymerase sigma factor [Actinomycetota bacterium]
MAGTIDERLGAAQAERRGIDALYQRHRVALAHYADRLGAEDPEGIVDLAMADLLRGLVDPWDREEPVVRAYLYRAAHGHVVDELRRPFPPAVAEPDDLPIDGDPAAAVDDAMFLGELLEELSPLQQHVIRRRFYDDVSVVDLARELGTSKNAVHQAQHRAIGRLRALVAAALAVLLVAVGVALVNDRSSMERIDNRPVDNRPVDDRTPTTTPTTTASTNEPFIGLPDGPPPTVVGSGAEPVTTTTVGAEETADAAPPPPDAVPGVRRPAYIGVDLDAQIYRYDFGSADSAIADGHLGLVDGEKGDINYAGADVESGASGVDADPLVADAVTGSGMTSINHKLRDGTWRIQLVMAHERPMDELRIVAEGVELFSGDIAPGTVVTISETLAITDGELKIVIDDEGGDSSFWAVNGLTIWIDGNDDTGIGEPADG